MSGQDPYASPDPNAAPSAAPPSAAPPAGAPPYAPYAPGYGVPQTANNGLGTAALVLGIIGLVLFWTVFVGFICGLLGLIFGIIGRKRATRHEATNGGAALAGAITGGLALLGSIAIIAAGAAFFEHNKKAFDNYRQCVNHAQSQQQLQQCADEFDRNVQ